jgi:quercetin dioxygenase-like cupin family protein
MADEREERTMTKAATTRASSNAPAIRIPEAFEVASDDLPFAEDWSGFKGVRLKLLLADIEGGKFVVRIRFAPGTQLPPHKHSGEVHAFTLAGEWHYLEYKGKPPSKAGSYLYEPPGSTHTLKVADHNTEETDVLFVVYGAMLHMNEAGEIVAVGDAESHLRDYPAAIRAQDAAAKIGAIPVGGSMEFERL